jgi:hypothetical protein
MLAPLADSLADVADQQVRRSCVFPDLTCRADSASELNGQSRARPCALAEWTPRGERMGLHAQGKYRLGLVGEPRTQAEARVCATAPEP